MSASNFLACFHETESFEGGYVDDPHDPGGATLKGVTQVTYSAWLKEHGRPNAPVRYASDADIQAIYREYFWNPVRGDDIYDGLDLVIVDTGWGSGTHTAIRLLQESLGVAADGKFGPGTLAALDAHFGSAQLIDDVCNRRMAFFRSLSTWRYFGRGWTVRLNGIQAKALAMNKAAMQKAAPSV